MDYLLSYPFDCIEQETAKIIPLLAFDNRGSSFFGLEEGEREERVEELINLLGKIQNEDGGFPFWPDRRWSSSYFISVRVAHTLAMAVKAGYSLSNKLSVPMLLSYLQHPPAYVRKSSYLTTYALYARALWGEPVKGEALRAAAMGDALGMSGYALLGLTYEELGERKRAQLQLDRIKQFLKPGAQTVELVETREAGQLYDSPLYDSPMERLSLAMLLFEKLRPEDEMVTRLSKTISLKLHSGRPLITSYAVWAVLAYSELPELAEEKLPDFTALVTLEGSSLLKGEIEGVDSLPLKSTLRFDEEPIVDKEREELLPLRFEKNGRGTLYYTATMRYAIPTELISARDEGISVYSSITDVDGNPVTAQELKPGKTFSMHVTLSSSRERDFLALRVPVPSGAEILNASFTTSKRYGLQTEEGGGTGDGGSGGGRKRILEKEVQFVWDTFPAGKEEISFLFRTVHSGVYPLPPPKQSVCMSPRYSAGTGGGYLLLPPDPMSSTSPEKEKNASGKPGPLFTLSRKKLLGGAAVQTGITACILVLLFVFFQQPFPELDTFLRRKGGPVVLDRWGRVLQLGADDRGEYRFPILFDEIPEHTLTTFILAEDKRFFFHGGVDLFALYRALMDSLHAGKVISGGSGITMQLSRMIAARGEGLGARRLRYVTL